MPVCPSEPGFSSSAEGPPGRPHAATRALGLLFAVERIPRRGRSSPQGLPLPLRRVDVGVVSSVGRREGGCCERPGTHTPPGRQEGSGLPGRRANPRAGVSTPGPAQAGAYRPSPAFHTVPSFSPVDPPGLPSLPSSSPGAETGETQPWAEEGGCADLTPAPPWAQAPLTAEGPAGLVNKEGVLFSKKTQNFLPGG